MSDFAFKRAKREGVGLLIGLAGPSGSGKTFTALTLAKGMARNQPFAVIDTEAGRAKHYADQFEFDHGDLTAPFRPNAYADAIAAADAAGYPVIVVDSSSHEHAGEGGLLDMQEEDWAKAGHRDGARMASWIRPKMEHKRFVSRLLQVRAHLILCFRAEEKIEIVKENGKAVVRPKQSLTGLDGWMPVCEKNLPYEMTISFLLTPDAPGVAKPIKLQEQHRPFFPAGQPITEQAGAQLADWAAGSATAPAKREAKSRADELAAELQGIGEELGRGDEIKAAIGRHRAAHAQDLRPHVAWLEAQIERAREAATALAGVGAEGGE